MSLVQQKLDADIRRIQRRSATDYLIDGLTPVMIFVMVTAVIMFLLDVRWVYTAVHDMNIRFVAFFFIVGVVALNRLIARDGSEESFLYFLFLAGAIALYTVATTEMYDVGSINADEESSPLGALAVNMSVVIFIWWLTNRLTHECCVDEDPTAGEVGILTGTVRKFRGAMAEGDAKKGEKREPFFKWKEKPTSSIPMNEIMAVDPTDWNPDANAAAPEPAYEAPVKRMPKRHPGISIFYFSVPVLLAFAVGLRVTQHGGDAMMRMGHFYMGCYCVSALSLLMLSSLGGLREYFRSRGVRIPGGLGPFWIGLGSVMIAMVLVGALALPLPKPPPLAIIGQRTLDPWNRGDTFQPMPVVSTFAEQLEQSRFIEYISYGVLACFGLLLAYGAARGLGAIAMRVASQRHHYPQFIVRFFDWIDRLIQRIFTLPTLPRLARRRQRVSRDIALSAPFKNPMGLEEHRPSPNECIEISYAALCALATDMGVPRAAGQTPYEFIEAFPRELKSLRKEAAELTSMYVSAAYSEASFTEKNLDRLRKFWQKYENVRRSVIK
jgi:hypothetical protein